jgi:hypothetical protein
MHDLLEEHRFNRKYARFEVVDLTWLPVAAIPTRSHQLVSLNKQPERFPAVPSTH